MRKQGRMRAGPVLLCAACVATPAAAKPPRKQPGHERTLRGHLFPRPVFEAGAFLPTTVGFRQGFLYQNDGEVRLLGQRKPLAAAAVVESLDLTVQVLDWMAVSAAGDLTALLSASEAALYGSPSQFAGGVSFGPVLRVLRVESTGTQLAIRPAYRAAFGAIVDVSHVLPSLRDRAEQEAASPPANASEAVQRATALENDLLRSSVAPIRRSNWGGSVHLAQAIAPQLGLQISYTLQHERVTAVPYDLQRGQLPAQSFSSQTHLFTAALSFDANAWKIPLALVYEVSVTATRAGTWLTPVVLTGPGLYYTRLRSLQIGFHAALEKGGERLTTPFGTGAPPTAYFGQFSMRTYFDGTH